MSDAPMDSIESVESGNVTHLTPENDTNLTPDATTDQELKMVSVSRTPTNP